MYQDNRSALIFCCCLNCTHLHLANIRREKFQDSQTVARAKQNTPVVIARKRRKRIEGLGQNLIYNFRLGEFSTR